MTTADRGSAPPTTHPYTPWGRANRSTDVGDGITFNSTPSHGGFYVPRNLLARVRPEWRAYAAKWSDSEQWYEEDCASAFVVLSFPEHFTDQQAEDARATVSWLETRDLAVTQ